MWLCLVAVLGVLADGDQERDECEPEEEERALSILRYARPAMNPNRAPITYFIFILRYIHTHTHTHTHTHIYIYIYINIYIYTAGTEAGARLVAVLGALADRDQERDERQPEEEQRAPERDEGGGKVAAQRLPYSFVALGHDVTGALRRDSP